MGDDVVDDICDGVVAKVAVVGAVCVVCRVLDVIDEGGGGGGVKRHASSVDKSQKRINLNNSHDNSIESDESKGELKLQ